MSCEKSSDTQTHVGLMEGRVLDHSGRDMGTTTQSCSISRIWIVLAVVFFIVSLALAIYVAYDKLSVPSKESDVVRQYPGYFRAPEEQAAIERQVDEEFENGTVTPAAPVNDTGLGYCAFTCENNARQDGFYRSSEQDRYRRSTNNHPSSLQWYKMIMTFQKLQRDRREVQNTLLGPAAFHGCCISRHKFISPDEAQSLSGSMVKIVQFSKQRQYFPSEECKQVKSCNGCGCAQEDTVVTAVVKNEEFPDDSPDEFILNFIKLPGCCKCFNNLKNA